MIEGSDSERNTMTIINVTVGLCIWNLGLQREEGQLCFLIGLGNTCNKCREDSTKTT